ncbi:MAG: hypothetical protein JWO69_618 [Thermoleophilia bacterium]|jgi:hypothetical protein|nr:hypothetical protein [Thermoleophilia bacterium]
MASYRSDGGASLPSRASATRGRSTASSAAMVGGGLLLAVGAINVVHSLTLFNEAQLLEDTYLYDNVNFWAWTFMIWGVLQAVAGAAVIATRSALAAMAGMTFAAISMVAWFFMIFAAPFAALVGIMLNVAILHRMADVARDDAIAGPSS